MYNYSNGTPKKTKLGTSYLTRPRLSALKNLYPNKPLTRPTSSYGLDKKKKTRKPNASKMDFRKRPDYADTAYREAVNRLRILLAESYTPIKRQIRELDSGGEETDNQSLISAGSRTSRPVFSNYRSNLNRRFTYYTPPRSNYNATNIVDEKILTPLPPKYEGTQAPAELLSFIERQEEYIEQLEKESRFCREELGSLLGKVKDVISENENLHEKQKSNLIKSVFDHLETETETETETDFHSCLKSPKKNKRRTELEGPVIVFESRISELEAQLTQTKINLRKAMDENEIFKKKIADGSIMEGLGYDTYKKQLDTIQREKNTLQETVNKLQHALSQFRDKENETSDQVKRSLDAVELAQYERGAADQEIRRLKDELERQHGKLRDAINDQSRRITEERTAVERRYSQQIEQLTNELGVQWESSHKLQLELDKQRRENSDLRRESAQKQAYIDELKKDLQCKIASLQSDIGVNGAEKSALEHQISTHQLAFERCERQAKQDIARLQAEMQSLRQRLDRADADLIHSRRENIRLNEQVAALEKELKMNDALSDERSKHGSEIISLPGPIAVKDDREKELSSMIQGLETKHAATVAELEGMIHSQNQLMDKLTGECHTLTQKLEEASSRHKVDRQKLRLENTEIMGRLQNIWKSLKEVHGTAENNPLQMTSTIWLAINELHLTTHHNIINQDQLTEL